MQTFIATLLPRSAFGNAIRGDTLFGQLCWAACNRWGETRLTKLLADYTNAAPFLVVSDAFPSGYLPCPALPLHCYAKVPGVDRKAVKKRIWLPHDEFSRPVVEWLQYAKSEQQIQKKGLLEEQTQSHNTINRMTGTTGTTGTGDFTPYTMSQYWYAEGQQLDIYLVFDENKIRQDEITRLLEDIGMTGYGRDASIGLGKFSIESITDQPWLAQNKANAWLTLAPCAPQGQGFDTVNSWYQPFTRFGRHGDRAVHSGKPFKAPVLLADAAALLIPETFEETAFIGMGLGGDGSLSKAIETTVHQGYAPVLPVHMEKKA